MKTRKEVAEFINNGTGGEDVADREKGNQWHFGKQDLRQLMDFIYGGEPKNEDEHITSCG